MKIDWNTVLIATAVTLAGIYAANHGMLNFLLPKADADEKAAG